MTCCGPWNGIRNNSGHFWTEALRASSLSSLSFFSFSLRLALSQIASVLSAWASEKKATWSRATADPQWLCNVWKNLCYFFVLQALAFSCCMLPQCDLVCSGSWPLPALTVSEHRSQSEFFKIVNQMVQFMPFKLWSVPLCHMNKKQSFPVTEETLPAVPPRSCLFFPKQHFLLCSQSLSSKYSAFLLFNE